MVVNGQTSETLPVLSGVPQGSVIGPLLFLIYIDGVMSVPLSQGSQLTVYADDILLYRPITCHGDFPALQEDINILDAWIEANYLQFNISKCKYYGCLSEKSRHLTCISYTAGPPSRACYMEPLLQKNINTLENVQKKALRMCSKCWDQAYSQLLQLSSKLCMD